MKIYFSGGRRRLIPEYLMPERKPNVMVTFIEAIEMPRTAGTTIDRLKQHVMRKQGRDLSIKAHPTKTQPSFKREQKKIKQEKTGIIY